MGRNRSRCPSDYLRDEMSNIKAKLTERKETLLLTYFLPTESDDLLIEGWEDDLIAAMEETRVTYIGWDWLEHFLSKGWDLRDIAAAIEQMSITMERLSHASE